MLPESSSRPLPATLAQSRNLAHASHETAVQNFQYRFDIWGFVDPVVIRSCQCTAVSSEAWAKLRDWASVASRGRLLVSGSIAHASLKTAVVSLTTCVQTPSRLMTLGTLQPRDAVAIIFMMSISETRSIISCQAGKESFMQ